MSGEALILGRDGSCLEALDVQGFGDDGTTFEDRPRDVRSSVRRE